MGCGASKKDVVETGEQKGNKSPPPEKKEAAKSTTSEPAAQPAAETKQEAPPAAAPPPANPPPAQEPPKEAPPAASQPAAEAQPPNTQPAAQSSSPPPASPPPPAATAPAPAQPPAAEHKKADEHKPEVKHDIPPLKESKIEALPPIGTPHRKAQLVEIDLGNSSVPPSPHGSKTAVQERLERYADDRKVGVIRPSSASLERRMQEADSRRKQHADQKIKKAKYTNELAKDKYSELREAEEKKTQELMQLIKNKNSQAATNRSQIQQEVKAKAEGDVVKARELSARKREGGGSTPHTPKTPHTESALSTDRSGTDEEVPVEADKQPAVAGADKSILEVPLPPLK